MNREVFLRLEALKAAHAEAERIKTEKE